MLIGNPFTSLRPLWRFNTSTTSKGGTSHWYRVLWFAVFVYYNPIIARLRNRRYWYRINFKVVPYVRW